MSAPSSRLQVRKHASGLRVQRVTGPVSRMHQRHVVQLPPCCPVSKNPREGSTLVLSYVSDGWCLDVYSLRGVVRRFVGGWVGTAEYPAERNMEGMLGTLAQMAADALRVPVRFRAELVLDAGAMHVRGKAVPQ